MAFSSGGGSENSVMAEINTTPLVDVMLVLLIIFMITAPLMASKIPVDLPNATNEPEASKDDQDDNRANVVLSIQDVKGGQVKYFWAETPVTLEALEQRIYNEAAKGRLQPILKIRADKTVTYKAVADVMAIAKRTGLMQVRFITAPDQANAQ